jgi:hypothetical protein
LKISRHNRKPLAKWSGDRFSSALGSTQNGRKLQDC